MNLMLRNLFTFAFLRELEAPLLDTEVDRRAIIESPFYYLFFLHRSGQKLLHTASSRNRTDPSLRNEHMVFEASIQTEDVQRQLMKTWTYLQIQPQRRYCNAQANLFFHAGRNLLQLRLQVKKNIEKILHNLICSDITQRGFMCYYANVGCVIVQTPVRFDVFFVQTPQTPLGLMRYHFFVRAPCGACPLVAALY